MPPSTRPSSSRASSVNAGVRSHHTQTQSTSAAALQGATLAFLSVSPSNISSGSTSHGGSHNGALAAASSSRSRTPNRGLSRSPLPNHCLQGSLGGSNTGDAIPQADMRVSAMEFANRPQLAPPTRQQRPASTPSPSQQAAVLAAARAPPPAPAPINTTLPRRSARPVTATRPPVAPKPRNLSGNYSGLLSKDGAEEKNDDSPTDNTPIAPTTSLVDLFEQRLKETQPPGKRPGPVVIKPSEDLPLKSPTPMRSGITSMIRLELEENGQTQPTKDLGAEGSMSETKGRMSSDDSFASASEDLNARSPPGSPPVSAPRRMSKTVSPSRRHLNAEDLPQRRQAVSPSLRLQTESSKPIEIKPPVRTGTAQSDALSISSSHSLQTIPAQFNHAYPRRMTPLTTGDELANALVASSLASSRAPSPTKEKPPVPTRRRKNHHHHHYHHYHKLSFSRTPSPTKTGMLRTLRKQDDGSSSDEEEENEQHPYGHHRKKRLLRKHPNKHHEGDRKRWRDAVTERERKRYEGVWAANKGLHYTFTYEEQEFFKRAPNHPKTTEKMAAVNNQVSNLVTRDIWNRSRLAETVLETVWDLVDNDSVGRLNKEEFVVGMWLIDQRLKGRKLPVKVTETVWASVRGLSGIKVKVKK